VSSALRAEAQAGIAACERFLASRQAPDRYWRDYWLKPGPSEDWVTACCALALARAPASATGIAAARDAAHALARAARAGGWGYNRDTVADADSTAWVLRVLAAFGWDCSDYGPSVLHRYLDAQGRAHTFVPPEQAGSWGRAHADVTPVVGIALCAVGASPATVARVRDAVLHDQAADGSWRSFWWATDAYATARSLEFLALCGGVPAQCAARARTWLESDGPTQPLALAQALAARTFAGARTEPAVDALLVLQLEDGSWPPSSLLLAPDHDDPAEGGPAYADLDCTLGSAMVTLALKSWLTRAS